jgi:hypothetical protein
MLSITAVLGSHEFGLRIRLGAQRGSQMYTGRADVAGSSTVFPTLNKGLEIELSHFKADDMTLRGDYLWQVVEIVIGGVQTVLEVCFQCLFMALGRILLQHCASTNLVD